MGRGLEAVRERSTARGFVCGVGFALRYHPDATLVFR